MKNNEEKGFWYRLFIYNDPYDYDPLVGLIKFHIFAFLFAKALWWLTH